MNTTLPIASMINDARERAGLSPATIGSFAVRRLDADQSGGLSQSEVAGRGYLETRFNAVDADNDGVVTASEMDARVAGHRHIQSTYDGAAALFQARLERSA